MIVPVIFTGYTQRHPPPWKRMQHAVSVARGIQRDLEALYALNTGLAVEDFIRLEEKKHRRENVRACVVFSCDGEHLDLAVVLPASQMRTLRKNNPRSALSSNNINAFCAIAEEISHFLHISWHAHNERQTTLLAMELQAEVDKFLSCALYLTQQGYGNERNLNALATLLFEHYTLHDNVTDEAVDLYHYCSSKAYAYAKYLMQSYLLPQAYARLFDEVRSFYRSTQEAKLYRIEQIRLAA